MSDDFDYDLTPAEPRCLQPGEDPWALSPEFAAGLKARAIVVGDLVHWNEVPNGSLVMQGWDNASPLVYLVRHNDSGWGVGRIPGAPRAVSDRPGPWPWTLNAEDNRSTLVQIVALGLTGDETAADLRALAEAFETSRGA